MSIDIKFKSFLNRVFLECPFNRLEIVPLCLRRLPMLP